MAGRGAGRLDVGGEAEADVAALRQRVGLFLAEAFVVEDLHGLLEGVGRGDVVVRHAVGVDVRHLVAAQDVAAAQLDGIDADLARCDVEKDFAREGFVLPGAAVGGEPGGVREHRLVVEAGLRDAVRAGEEHADRGGGQHRVRRRIRADVLDEVDVGGEDVAVLVERHPGVAVDVSRLPGGHQVFAPVLDPLQRRGHLTGGQHDAHVFAHRHDLLAEAAAGVAHDDPDTLCGNAEQARAERPQLVRGLGGRPDGEFLGGRRPFDDHAPRLDRHRHIDLLVDVRGHDVCGRVERLLVWRCAREAAGDVVGVGVVDHHVGGLGLGEVGDRGQRLVVDVDELDRVLGDVAVLGDHERDRVADELHLALGQRWARSVGNVPAGDGVPGLLDVRVEVGGGEHRAHTGQRQRRRRVDAVDAGPRQRAAHEAGVQHAGPGDVVDEGAVAGEQPGVLYPRDPRSHVSGGDGPGRGRAMLIAPIRRSTSARKYRSSRSDSRHQSAVIVHREG